MITPSTIKMRPKRPISARLAAHEQRHPQENEQRRKPRKIEREHQRHQRRADIGAEHHRKAGGGVDEPLADKRRYHHRGGGTALDQRRDASRGKRGVSIGPALAQEPGAGRRPSAPGCPVPQYACPTPARPRRQGLSRIFKRAPRAAADMIDEKCVSGGVGCPASFAASSQSRSSTARSAPGLAMKLEASAAEKVPPCKARLRLESAESTSWYAGLVAHR